MFCPRCNQEQISESVRYCSRCGLPLEGVRAALASDGLAEDPAAAPPTPDRSLRKRDLTIGAMLMFLCALVAAALTVDMPPSHSARIVLLVVAWLGLSLLINLGPLFRYFFGGGSATPSAEGLMTKRGRQTLTRPDEQNHPPALSPASFVPASSLPGVRDAKTAEVAAPPSVTDQTTRLLDGE